jgi:CBS domain containing-hemolysin-like protein
VLIPRAQVSMLQADTKLSDAIAFVREDGHTRLPVYGRDRDDVLGWVHARDLLAHAGKDSAHTTTVREIQRVPFFVPVNKPLNELLDEMRKRKVHLAIVLNEIGATAGVVSLEDLLEEIVGDIHDEHDVEERRLPRPEDVLKGDVPLDARLRVEDANRLLKLDLPLEPDAYDTLAGLLLHRLGRIPKAGESLALEGATLSVLEADERRVRRVRLLVDRKAARPA